jgi:quinol monooxygenase YgiN
VSALYTHGVWTVIPGREDQFVAAWNEFAQWSRREAPGAGWAKLLRDSAQPNRFVTVGPWESRQAIEEWRALPGWQERIGRIRPLLERFEPSTLQVVTEIE